jgi:adenylate kinase family enzyme
MCGGDRVTVAAYVYVTLIVAAYFFFAMWRREKENRQRSDDKRDELERRLKQHEAINSIKQDVYSADDVSLSERLRDYRRD